MPRNAATRAATYPQAIQLGGRERASEKRGGFCVALAVQGDPSLLLRQEARQEFRGRSKHTKTRAVVNSAPPDQAAALEPAGTRAPRQRDECSCAVTLKVPRTFVGSPDARHSMCGMHQHVSMSTPPFSYSQHPAGRRGALFYSSIGSFFLQVERGFLQPVAQCRVGALSSYIYTQPKAGREESRFRTI